MSRIGRNDPCPCGSGKKYKKCCLLQEEAATSQVRGERSAVQTALDWLHTKYPEEVDEAVYSQFFGERDEPELEALSELPSHFAHAVHNNIGEWLLTDAELSIDDRDIPTRDLILGPKGPTLSPQGRAWLQELGKRPLSLYEVCEVNKGEGLLLKDLLYPDQAPVWVREKTATEYAAKWDILGARLAEKEGDLVLSGAAYPMERAQALACLEEIRSEIAGD